VIDRAGPAHGTFEAVPWSTAEPQATVRHVRGLRIGLLP
jgi:hypothetical protein